jgi:hypothetical protein
MVAPNKNDAPTPPVLPGWSAPLGGLFTSPV